MFLLLLCCRCIVAVVDAVAVVVIVAVVGIQHLLLHLDFSHRQCARHSLAGFKYTQEA